MVKTFSLSNSPPGVYPNYAGLVHFLVSPFLESPTSLSVDCEQSNEKKRVWIRMAFEGEDKGRVYGRGGRNLQAIRTVLSTAAAAAGQSLYLEVYESPAERAQRLEHEKSERSYNFDKKPHPNQRRRTRRASAPRFPLKPQP